MYLKEIKAHGFKSFADKINIELKEGITGIVGPNGSGKSNVVDAVRWVLGEQSVKSLRGEGAMTDVIFSGSKSRKALNVASVTLVFDNSDKYLPIDFGEVSITRRVYHDGTNEYLLNNERCRLKDITDLFLDSGIGKESFNIISQGKIEEILSNKPEDRRVVFEEAAGVLKYKKRKIEALHKLDRTHDNMNRIEDIIHELELQVEPLKKEKEKAIAYLELQKKLENLEISLITKDITTYNEEYQKDKKRIDELKEEIIELSTQSSKSEVKVEELTHQNQELNNQITETQSKLTKAIQEMEQENSKKQILLERKKYEVEDQKIHDALVNAKEQVNLLKVKIEEEQNLLKELESNYQKEENESESFEQELQKVRFKKQEVEGKLSKQLRENAQLDNKIMMLQEAIERNASLPFAVRRVLENPKLRGICDAIGNVVEVEEQYATAISVSLGASSSYIIVENEIAAKEAIQFLKEGNIGRATFFPLNVIKPKTLDREVLSTLRSTKGFVGIGKDLVKCNPKYQNIIDNQLGNVIIARNLDEANQISKLLQYRYKIVTLEGELLHIGGSLTGGRESNVRNRIKDQYDLEHLLKEKEIGIEQVKIEEEKINEIDENLKEIEDRIYLKNREKNEFNEQLERKKSYLEELKNDLKTKEEEIERNSHILNHTLSVEEETIISAYYEAMSEKNCIQNELDRLLKERKEFNETMEEYQRLVKKDQSSYQQKNKELQALEISVNRLDVKLDHLLNSLSETYNMTYERARESYHLELEENEARIQVSNMKQKLKDIGPVNLNAEEEYEKVSTRYEFLLHQKEDLIQAENTLLEIISEMDEVMKSEFLKTFEVIQKHFKETFHELFKGGTAELKLTEPKNLLETGIEIIASPPGKKLTTISLLSGGEKTFTAISLLFAILKSRPVPFCILDEVEAALDEVNVDSFGNYLKNLQSKTQFILITHKKKTMEYADVLYGITMQESGVSKLVSVKLEEIKK